MSTTDPAADPSAAPSEATELLAQLSFGVMGRLSTVASEEDMSLTQLRMLGILRDRTPRMADLASRLGVDRSSVSGLIARAERRGLVKRVAAEDDARGVSVVITPEGLAFAVPAMQRISAELEPLLAVFDAEERAQFARLLAKITGH